jgi:hypothetical protein
MEIMKKHFILKANSRVKKNLTKNVSSENT